jgi:hypothetical protein
MNTKKFHTHSDQGEKQEVSVTEVENLIPLSTSFQTVNGDDTYQWPSEFFLAAQNVEVEVHSEHELIPRNRHQSARAEKRDGGRERTHRHPEGSA